MEVRGLIGTSVNVYEEMCIDAATGIEQGEGVACQYRDVTYSQVVLAKRDVLKVREELEIPQNKPNIQEILWQCVALRNMETKAGDEKLLVRGEIEIFILYKSEVIQEASGVAVFSCGHMMEEADRLVERLEAKQIPVHFLGAVALS